MSSEPISTYSWYPTASGGETLRQQEERITKDWMRENLSSQAQLHWLRSTAHTMERKEVIHAICKYDSAELVELLYPRDDTLFRKARRYTLSPALFSNLYEGPFSEEVLQQCVCARTACLDAACLFALSGAAGCLEALLENGIDPNGLDTPAGWSYIELPNGNILPVSPMDCALLGDNENCQFLLELYGGDTLHEHLKDC